MFSLRYIGAELRRRKGRTILTALGLGVGVATVVAVAALSAGLDDAQSEVLDPLTGVGTDMSATRPIVVSDEGGEEGFAIGPGAELSAKEQRQLERENGGGRVALTDVGEPGERFTDQNFMSQNLSFPEREASRVAGIDGVEDVAPALTLDSITVSGKVPEEAASGEPQLRFGGPPESIDFEQSSVTGIDVASPDLALVTPDRITDGRYLRSGEKDGAILTAAYAEQNGFEVGDKVDVGDEKFEVVGLASAGLGGESSDIYVHLSELQRLSDREGRANVLRVRAESSDQVAGVAAAVESDFRGSSVTTAQDLADQVTGSLSDAQDLSGTLGTALAAVALLGAILIASLLTLSSVAKRTRELGTLKAIGWRGRQVVRQIAGESLAQGVLGGAVGAAMGIGAAALIGALGISLEASVAAAESGPVLRGPGAAEQSAEAATEVVLGAPVDPGLVLMAVGLAALGGLIAGAVGAARAARLRPAEALRSVE
jgi:ABC-type antimicrobial peptide transport system permease subunit